MDSEADLLEIRRRAQQTVDACNAALARRRGRAVRLPEGQVRAATVASECRFFIAEHGAMTLDDARTIIHDHYPRGTGRLFGDRFTDPGQCRVLYREGTVRGTRPAGDQKVSLTDEGLRLAALYDEWVVQALSDAVA